MKKFLPGLAFLFAALWLLSAAPAGAAQTPEDFVGEFYTWYMAACNDGGDPWEDEAMMKYVARDTVEAVRAARRDPVDFLQSGMVYDWNSPVAHPAFPMAGDLMVVPVSMRMAGEDWHVIVFVKQDGETMSIVKTANIFPLLRP